MSAESNRPSGNVNPTAATGEPTAPAMKPPLNADAPGTAPGAPTAVMTEAPKAPAVPKASGSEIDPANVVNEKGFIPTHKFLPMCVAQGVSDIHLRVGFPPMIRIHGEMSRTKLAAVSEEAMRAFIKDIMPANLWDKMGNKMDFDFSFAIPGMARFRVNLFHELNNPGLVLRIINTRIPTLDQLGMPSILHRFTELPKGIVLVTGPTGSGKSTTLAAMLNTINHGHAKHIVTLEDPIEYVYTADKCAITQRQLGTDTESFPAGIKYALRQDPDVILIGELRDRETISAALHAAETGHLVFSTLHTNDAVQTINRIINVFEPFERDSVRTQIADILQGTVAQRLIKRADGQGRVPVAEIMLVTPAVRDYIRKGDIDNIYDIMKSNDYDGVCSMNQSLFRALKNNLITIEDALKVTHDPNEFQQMLRGGFHGQAKG